MFHLFHISNEAPVNRSLNMVEEVMIVIVVEITLVSTDNSMVRRQDGLNKGLEQHLFVTTTQGIYQFMELEISRKDPVHEANGSGGYILSMYLTDASLSLRKTLAAFLLLLMLLTKHKMCGHFLVK